jgi:hypothetical protein
LIDLVHELEGATAQQLCTSEQDSTFVSSSTVDNLAHDDLQMPAWFDMKLYA